MPKESYFVTHGWVLCQHVHGGAVFVSAAGLQGTAVVFEQRATLRARPGIVDAADGRDNGSE